MVWVDAVLGLLAIALSLEVWRRSTADTRAIEGLADSLRRSGALLIELRRRIEQQRQLAEAQQLTETAVDVGTQAVRQVHFGIAAIPFGLLEALPATRDTTRVVRQAHDVIANAVYGTIRGVNRLSGQATRSALGLRTERDPGVSGRDDHD